VIKRELGEAAVAMTIEALCLCRFFPEAIDRLTLLLTFHFCQMATDELVLKEVSDESPH
jgi:hypothetical protein